MRFIISLFLFLSSCGPAIKLNCPGTLNIKNMTTPVYFSIGSEFTSAEQDAIVRAAQNWNQTMGQELLAFSPGGYRIYKVPTLNGGLQGVANISWRNGYIEDINIAISQLNLNYIDMESLMIHEFGHALGLAHVDGGVMDPYLSYFEIRRTIDQKSINSMQCLY